MKKQNQLKTLLNLDLTCWIKYTVAHGLIMSLLISTAYADLGKSYRDAEKLSSGDKVKLAATSLSSMQDTLKFTLQELQSSYDKKDVVQTNCVKDKLSTIKGLLRISEEAEINLSEAVVTGQVDLVNHEFVKIKMASERVKDLQAQVANCVKNLDDPLLNDQQQKSKPEVLNSAVEEFTATADESTVILYDPIATERPEAISKSE
jgi:hypothetical protein